METKSDEIKKSRKILAKCLNLLEALSEELDYVFERHPDWNNAVKYQIEEAAGKLGFALATLTNWYDDEQEEKK